MKRINIIKLKQKVFLLLAVVMAVVLSACEPVKPDYEDDVPFDSSEGSLNDTEFDSEFDEVELGVADCPPPCDFTREAINDPNSPLAQRLIFFDFDQAEINSEFQELIENHAKYLMQNADVNVRLEGHTDERGSREYNVALGEKRAMAVRRFLLLQGVLSEQVSVVSFGEELPLDLGNNEAAWAQNRRVELVYDIN